jgi:hypothetical protein
VRARVYIINWSSDVILGFVGRHFLYFDLMLVMQVLNISRQLVHPAGASAKSN